MAYSVEQISEQIFKIVKGFGHAIVLFTDDGKKTSNPEEARRFFVKDNQMMINFIADETTSEIVVNLSKDIDIKTIKPLLSSLRNLANRYIIEYTVKTFGKSIAPKDFAYQARAVKESTMDISEGFSGWHGSARKSVNELGDARLIVMHKRNVDETSRGARTRQIESIFIENNQGERFKFPSKSLTAAKAMVRHVKEGGTPFDEFGQYIYECMEELGQLKTFQRKNRRNDFFEDANISEEINNRIASLRSTLGQISGPKGYAHHFESFKKEGAEVAPEKLDELKDNVTVRYFDEAISGSLPYVARIIENMHSRQEKEQQIVALAKHVMDNKDNIELSRPIDNDDPENPGARKFRDPATAIAAWVSYLAPLLKDDELANKLMQVSDTVFDVGAKHANMAAAAINVIRSRARVAETTSLGEKKKSLADSEMHKITEAFDKYNVRKIFGV